MYIHPVRTRGENPSAVEMLRRFYGTKEYHKTKDSLHVQGRLGRRDIKTTLIYAHLMSFEGDAYYTATAKSLKEDEELLKGSENELEVISETEGQFTVKHHPTGDISRIVNTFAETCDLIEMAHSVLRTYPSPFLWRSASLV